MSPYGKEKTQLSRNEIIVFFHSKLNDIEARVYGPSPLRPAAADGAGAGGGPGGVGRPHVGPYLRFAGPGV